MAQGSDESEDYWPGYVDALTSMVQVLAFVMMLLAMAVFVLSQNVAKGAVEMIAKAANIEVPKNAGVLELTTKVLDALQSARDAATKSLEPPPAHPPPELRHPQPEPERLTGSAPAPGPNPTAATEKIIHSALRQKPPAPVPEGKRTWVLFRPASFVIEETAQADIRRVVTDQISGREMNFLIRGFAGQSSGSLSEARRLAYYRAMSVRRALLAQNVPAAAIQVRIVDTPDVEQGRTAEIILAPAQAQ